MKIPYMLLLLTVGHLCATSSIYESFSTEQNRTASWLTDWHRLQGTLTNIPESLKIKGLQSKGGALQLLKKGEALAQHRIMIDGSYFGSYRVQASKIKADTILGLLLSRPMREGLTPKTASIGFLAKGWKTDLGVLLVDGVPVKVLEGIGLSIDQTYLVVFHVVNEGTQKAVTMWILNESQASYFASNKVTPAILNAAPLSRDAGGVLQRVRHQKKKDPNLTIFKGDIVACVAKYCPDATFDEIRIVSGSLKEGIGAQK